jgi:hypothetical protein
MSGLVRFGEQVLDDCGNFSRNEVTSGDDEASGGRGAVLCADVRLPRSQLTTA